MVEANSKPGVVRAARKIQMWDRDILSANDIIAETSIDLYRWFLKVCVYAAIKSLVS